MSSPRRIVVPLRPGTDGDASHTPKAGTHVELNPPTLYLEKIADQWMQTRGEAQPGAKYILESLPAGYTLWQRPRPKDPKVLDKYLYGHPGGKFFDSPNRFYPHFQHLMDHGDSFGCPCTVCSGSTGVLPRSTSISTKARSSSGTSSKASSRPSTSQSSARPFPAQSYSSAPGDLTLPVSKPRPNFLQPNAALPAPSVPHKGRPKQISTGMDTTRIDEEGTPDVYRNLINKLRRHEKLDELIEEPFSLDWRTEQELLPNLLQKVGKDPQWMPRVGDIVLYVRDLPDDVHILRYPITSDYRMYDEKDKQWLEQPIWEAGLVGQTPSEETTIKDVCEDGEKQGNITYYGLRIEPLPDVNSSDKSLSKRHKYVPVRHTRPFVLWKELLHGATKLHPTISNAQTITATMSLTAKYRFKGIWPEATIYCRAMYLGYEMLAVGDAVRLLPNASHGQISSTDILVIKSIRLKWSNLDNASDNDWDEGRSYGSAVWIYGTAYTNDSTRQNKEWLSDANPPRAADHYGEWYPLHPPTKELAVPYSRVMGRLYEHDTMALWLNIKSRDHPFLDAGREGLIEARSFARQHDNRIASHPEANWYWADSRAQALDLHTVNGLDVSTHDTLRDTKEWRKKIKIMEGMSNPNIVQAANSTSSSALASRNLRGFMAPALSDLPVRAPLAKSTEAASASGSISGSSTAGESLPGVSRKRRPEVVHLSSDEDEEDEEDEMNRQIREATRIIEDAPGVPAKKARVAVTIGPRRV